MLNVRYYIYIQKEITVGQRMTARSKRWGHKYQIYFVYTDWKHTSGSLNRSSELECSPYHRLNNWSAPSLHQSIICSVHKIHLSFFLDFPSRWPFWDHMVLSGLSWDDIIMRWSLVIEASWSGTGITQPNLSVSPLFLSNLIPSDPLSCYFICLSQHHKLNTFCFY